MSNIKTSLKKCHSLFEKNDIDNSVKEAEMLLSFVLKKPKTFLYTHPEKELSIFESIKIKSLTRKRLKGFSLAVLFGEKDFLGHVFKVDKNVLVPRPETETMVLTTLKKILEKSQNSSTIIDLGTGSACIIISIIKELKKQKLSINQYDFLAVDKYAKALKIAKENAQLNSLEKVISFYQGNLLEPILETIKNKTELIITANLPYLTEEQVKNSLSIQKEPKNALVAGLDGLDCYRELFKQLKNFEKNNIWLICEIDPGQTKKISKLIKNSLPGYSKEIKKDLRGLDRFVVISNKK